MIQRKCDQVIFIPTCLVVQYLPVYLAMLSSSSGYLVNLSISTGMMSFSCSRRHRRFLSAAWGTARKKETDLVGNFPQELNLAQRLTDIGLNNCSLSFTFNFVTTSFSGFILFQTDMLVFPHWSPERTDRRQSFWPAWKGRTSGLSSSYSWWAPVQMAGYCRKYLLHSLSSPLPHHQTGRSRFI